MSHCRETLSRVCNPTDSRSHLSGHSTAKYLAVPLSATAQVLADPSRNLSCLAPQWGLTTYVLCMGILIGWFSASPPMFFRYIPFQGYVSTYRSLPRRAMSCEAGHATLRIMSYVGTTR